MQPNNQIDIAAVVSKAGEILELVNEKDTAKRYHTYTKLAIKHSYDLARAVIVLREALGIVADWRYAYEAATQANINNPNEAFIAYINKHENRNPEQYINAAIDRATRRLFGEVDGGEKTNVG